MIPGGIDSSCAASRTVRSHRLIVFSTVSAVTDSVGSFGSRFPRARTYASPLAPLFEESDTFVWLEPGQHSTVKLVLTPKTRFLPPPPRDSAAAPAAQRAP